MNSIIFKKLKICRINDINLKCNYVYKINLNFYIDTIATQTSCIILSLHFPISEVF
jgi:hypothetical protein